MMTYSFCGCFLGIQNGVIDLVFLSEINLVFPLDALLVDNLVFHFFASQISFWVYLILEEELFLAPEVNDSI